ncbi:MAG: TonB family protein [Rhodocyclaceae bacterium]|nr:MAG: TonB family protein [Rhodocyclaceae bacterium]TND04886.1 MAG: TonB family protein [Rhodocyclaceae bacterium]
MPIYLALLLSFTLHTALIVAPAWLTAQQPPAPSANIEARLIVSAAPAPTADAVSTEAPTAPPSAAVSPPPAIPPNTLQDRALSRAQAALSQHLFYPPEAIALGLEGEVVLLLTLADNGRLVSAAVARSSGHALLDQAALDAAQRIGALPGNPRQTLFPVSFRLR